MVRHKGFRRSLVSRLDRMFLCAWNISGNVGKPIANRSLAVKPLYPVLVELDKGQNAHLPHFATQPIGIEEEDNGLLKTHFLSRGEPWLMITISPWNSPTLERSYISGDWNVCPAINIAPKGDLQPQLKREKPTLPLLFLPRCWEEAVLGELSAYFYSDVSDKPYQRSTKVERQPCNNLLLGIRLVQKCCCVSQSYGYFKICFPASSRCCSLRATSQSREP